ncbi:hypothetical protein D3C72_2100020 [compost metagenome]
MGIVFCRLGAVDEVHAGAADEAGDEAVGRLLVEIERRAELFDISGIEHHDAVGHGHGFDLIMGDVDHGGLELLVQFGDFEPHVDAQGGVEIGQGLVEQEGLGLAHNGPADGDALALTA